MSSALYLTRNGLMQPLGHSQVMAYLRGLSLHYRITVITFEDAEDLADRTAVGCLRSECEAAGMRWLPQRFYFYPRFIAPAWSVVVLFYLSLREVRSGAVLIHARSYIPAMVALVVQRLTGVPFIFDMRALWPEELITARRIRRGSVVHRVLTAVERACLRRAAAVVSLTEAAVTYLRATYPEELAGKRVVVIPTCADLTRFTPAQVPEGPRIIGCVGTVLSGWFRLDWLAAFFRAAAIRDPDVRFEIVTHDAAEKVRAAIGGWEDLQERLSIYATAPRDVHVAVQRQSASVMFYAGGALSELGRSPTRMAEVLGCGRPVVANVGVGDVARIIERYRVGVLVRENSETEITHAVQLLEELLSDPEIGLRCREAAENLFSLDAGTVAYHEIYHRLASLP